MAAITKEQAIEFLSNLDSMQLRVLVQEVEAKWGLQPMGVLVTGVWMPAAPMPIYGTSPVFVTEGTWGEEQYEFTVTLLEHGPNRIEAMKVVREILGCGLLESKNLVEHLPRVLKEDISKADAYDIQAKFRKIGAKVQID